MAKDVYILFVEKIICMTKDNNIIWKYLDSNTELCNAMKWICSVSPTSMLFNTIASSIISFDEEKSFYTSINHMYVVIYVPTNGLADIFVIPETYKNFVRISAERYGEYTTRLLNYVLSLFPDADRFISEFVDHDEGK